MYRFQIRRIAVAVLGILSHSLSVAQAPSDRADAARANAAAQQQLLQQQEAQQRAGQLMSPSVHLGREQARDEVVLPVEQPCFKISEFLLTVPDVLPAAARTAGASALPQDPFAFAREWLEQYSGRCLGGNGIGILVKNLNALILSRGYITTRVVVADEQNLAGGRLRLSLIPGTIGAIRFEDPRESGSPRSAFPARPGDLLELAALEQGLEQMRQIPSQDVDVKVVPAPAPGQSDVVVLVERQKPWRVTAFADNGGYRNTGKTQQALYLGIDNPLGLNDQLNLGVSRSAANNGGGTKGWTVTYMLPTGYWTTNVSVYANAYRQKVTGAVTTFSASGESTGGELRVSRVISRAQNHVLGIFAKLGKRTARGFIEDTEIPSQNRNSTYVEVGLSNRSYLGAMQVDADLAHRQGVPWLGAKDAPPNSAQTPYYRLQQANLSLKMPFSVADYRAAYISSAHVRYTPDQQFFVDALAIGNRWTVRGFDGESNLRGETGGYWRNEVETGLPGTRHALYAGLDYGRVGGTMASAQSGNQLAGMAVGVRGAWADGTLGALSFNLFLGTPLYKPTGFQTSNMAGGFEFAYQY
ncbi:ShlB/FhaC/HecB family hemolysin secretion/activation protein [Herbaspirillum robiniae]|uniref:ShlB/FhaC/HecB family hemolysin secretion/activation protein n=1 Tax=Herbaspirillum robiniae TaxID=2014887 RepID=A0A246WRB1_9BURK|nr:ShlB/FhaC/HecB family hemolysin secretion/activation protein [Herbaspirillum robiniae]OWY28880.1 hypothetical protein CEJ42_13005 [Herbaspirillum robiniae]